MSSWSMTISRGPSGVMRAVVGGIGQADGAREAHPARWPGRQLLALAPQAVHLAHDLRERVLDLVGLPVAVDGLPSAADATDAARP